MIIPIVTPNNHTDLLVELIAPDVTMQWIDGGRIVVTRVGRHTACDFDCWETTFRSVVNEWPIDRVLCTLLDFRSPQFGLSLYVGTRMRSLMRDYSNLTMAVAIVHNKTARSQSVMAAVKLIPYGKNYVYQP